MHMIQKVNQPKMRSIAPFMLMPSIILHRVSFVWLKNDSIRSRQIIPLGKRGPRLLAIERRVSQVQISNLSRKHFKNLHILCSYKKKKKKILC